jgi:hypothetical protein
MILGNVYDYYYSLEDENFIDRIGCWITKFGN